MLRVIGIWLIARFIDLLVWIVGGDDAIEYFTDFLDD